MKRALVIGAGGQVGTELVVSLRARYGQENVLATDLRPAAAATLGGPFEPLDCTDGEAVLAAVRRFRPHTVFHLAALLSVTGEERPRLAYRVNLGGLLNVLEAARAEDSAVFFASTIASFGPSIPLDLVPQDAAQRPTTMYGITKAAGEMICDYYHLRFRVDTRGLRFPGLISHVAEPGGGTTDYAVEVFQAAVARGAYTCPLRADTQLDMMYMPDAVRAAIELMQADPSRLTHRNACNIAAMQFTPRMLAAEIARHLPHFRMEYRVDPLRQAIADSWPRRIDDSVAREEWGWKPEYDIAAMTAEMVAHLRQRGSASPGIPNRRPTLPR